MMAKLITHLFLIVLIVAVAAGCASAPSRFYTLNSTAKSATTSAANYAVTVGPVSVPALVDRPQFIVQLATNRVAVDEFNRWAGPLNDNIARVVAGDLAVLLGTPRVASAPLANFDPVYRVTIDVQRFESVQNDAMKKEAAVIEAVWVVRKSAGGPARSGRTLAREPAQGDGFDALVAAHSRALAKVSADIAAAIRAEAAGKP